MSRYSVPQVYLCHPGGPDLAFHPPHQTFTVTHRVIALSHHHGVWITTKGDANNVRDPWGASTHPARRCGWSTPAIPRSRRYVSMWAKSPIPHLLRWLVVVLLICFGTLRLIWRR